MKVTVCLPFRGNDEYRVRNKKCVKKHLFTTFKEHELQIIEHDDKNTKGFNKGRACNQAFLESQANAEVIIFNDTDVVVESKYLLASLKLIDKYSYVVPFNSVAFMNREWSNTYTFVKTNRNKLITKQEVNYDGKDIELLYLNEPVGCCIVIKPQNFDKLGGFDERFTVWGYEDSSLKMTAETLIGPLGYLNSQAVHLWHPISYRQGNYQTQQDQGRALNDRYFQALNKPDEMRSLVNERKRSFLNGT